MYSAGEAVMAWYLPLWGPSVSSAVHSVPLGGDKSSSMDGGRNTESLSAEESPLLLGDVEALIPEEAELPVKSLRGIKSYTTDTHTHTHTLSHHTVLTTHALQHGKVR